MTTIRFMLLFALLIVLSVPAFCADSPEDVVDDYWMGIFYAGQRMGYLHVTVKNDKFEGKDVLSSYEVVSTRFTQSGKKTQRHAERIVHTDSQMSSVYDFVAMSEVDGDKSESKMSMEQRYTSNTVDVKLIQDGKENKSTHPLDSTDQVLVKAGWKYSLFDNKINIGADIALNRMRLLFGPAPGAMEFQMRNGTAKALRRQKLETDGVVNDTIVVSETTNENDEIIRYQLENGTILKEEQPLAKVTLVREPKEKAMEIEKGDGPNLDKPVDEIDYAGRLKSLPKTSDKNWMGIYYGNTKIGCLVAGIGSFKFNSKEMVAKNYSLRLRLAQGMRKFDCSGNSVVAVDDSFATLYQNLTAETKDSAYPQPQKAHMQIEYANGSAHIISALGGDPSDTTRDLSVYDMRLVKTGWLYELGLLKLKLGDKIQLNRPRLWIDSSNATMSYSFGEGMLSVLRRETVEVDGKSYDAFVVLEESKDLRIMRWQLDNGEVVKESYPDYNITLLRESKDKASEVLKGEEPDISKT